MVETLFSRFGKEAIWVAFGQVTASLGGLAAVKFLTGELGPEMYGQLALGMTAAGLVHMFIYGPIEQGALRFFSVYRERNEIGLLFAALRKIHAYAAMIVLAGTGMALLVMREIHESDWAILISCAAILGIAIGVNATFSSLQLAMRRRASAAIFQASDAWSRLAFACVVFYFHDTSADATLIGFCMATAATAAAQLTSMARDSKIKLELTQSAGCDTRRVRQSLHELTAYGRPYIAFAAFAWVSTYIDRWVILTYMDERAVGIYAVLVQVANAPIALFIGIANQFLVPLIFDRAGTATTKQQVRSSGRLIQMAAAVYILTLGGIIATAWVFGTPLIKLVANEKFAASGGDLWIICLGLSFSGIGHLFVLKGQSFGGLQKYILPKFIQFFMLLVSLLILTEPMGLTGVATSLCISGASYVVSVLLVNRTLSPAIAGR